MAKKKAKRELDKEALSRVKKKWRSPAWPTPPGSRK